MKTRPLPPAAISRRRMSCASSAVDAVCFEHRVDAPAIGLEDRGDVALSVPWRTASAGSFVAQQQGERVDEDGFSGAGFAGQQVEAGGELHGNVVDDRVVFDPQFQQHVSSRLAEVKRSVAGKQLSRQLQLVELSAISKRPAISFRLLR